MKTYGILCPISRACEVLEPRWTIQIILEILGGATRFNEIRRNLGGISPGVLSRRLSDMEVAGLIDRVEDKATATIDYLSTSKARALEPLLTEMAIWAQQNIDAEMALSGSSVSNIMWTLRRALNVDVLPSKRSVIRFHFSDLRGRHDTFWFLAQRGHMPELCIYDPGVEVDLYIETTSIALGGILMGRTTMAKETDRGAFFVSGDPRLANTIRNWLPVSRHGKISGILQLSD